MRRILIRFLLPLFFCLLPFLAGLLVVLAVPNKARTFYIDQVFKQDSHIDWLILGLGCVLFLIQMFLSWRALQWRGLGFDERPDRWINTLSQAAEWFPLLGLIGTVAGIMQTFSSITGQLTPHEIIKNYAPAITATGSGLFMALFNLLPSWVVLIGRDLILAVGGEETPQGGEVHP